MDKHVYNTINNNLLTEAEQLWEKCLVIIKDNLSWRTYQTWFEPIKAVNLTDSVLTLQVPTVLRSELYAVAALAERLDADAFLRALAR